jgi:signal peptidase I
MVITKNNQQRINYWWREWIKPLAVILVITASLRSTLADWNDVPTGSMRPTILEGDRIWVNKLAYDLKVPFTTWHMAEWGNPSRGDIVVCYSPRDGTRLVKRVVGLPGDRLEMVNNQLMINGRPMVQQPARPGNQTPVMAELSMGSQAGMEQLSAEPHWIMTRNPGSPAANYGPITVPAGQYFVMGDNRDNSFDSRFFGGVSRSRIIGRAEAIVLSLNRAKGYWPRMERFFTKLH